MNFEKYPGKWIPLLKLNEVELWRGTVFRFPAKHPFNDHADFMIIEEPDSPTGYKIICSTGYHAGQTELVFPEEASELKKGRHRPISVKWLKENWSKWVYNECTTKEVKVLLYYPINFAILPKCV